MSRKKVEREMQRVMHRLIELERSQDQLVDELGKYQTQIIKDIITDLSTYFKSDDIERKFCEWDQYEIPEAKPTWEETKHEVLRCISERTREFVQEWEDKRHLFAKSQDALIKRFAEKYDIMEEDIRKIGEEPLAGNPEEDSANGESSELPVSRKRGLSEKHRSGNAPVWLRQGLTSVVLSTPFMAALTEKLKEKFKYKRKLEQFHKDRHLYVEKKSRKCLKLIAREDSLLPFITKQLDDAVQFLVQIKAKIPRLRQSYKKFYRQLLADSRSAFEIQGIYQPINLRVDKLRTEIAVFEVTSRRTSNISTGKLHEQWSQDDESIVGKGNFSTVYRGVLKREGQPETKVALKVYNSPIESTNIRRFIEEEEVLSVLEHPNIVKFFGIHLLQSPCLTRVAIVLELCECSLKAHIIFQEKSSPAHSKDETARRRVLLWAKQILDALIYVHREGYVHQDLKLENLLLTADNKVKLSGVGVTRQGKKISGTSWGSLHMAPEVLAGEIYDEKAEMYSFGLLLWEMWYARTVFQIEIFSQHSQSQLLDQIKDGLRPSHIEGTHEPMGPWGMWKIVMETCWLSDPKERLTVEKSLKVLDMIDRSVANGKNDPLPEERQS